VSIKAGRSPLYLHPGHSGASSLNFGANTGTEFDIETVNYEFLNNEVVFEKHWDIFVKIDVEGHEKKVLETLSKWDHFKKVSKLFVEFDIHMSDVDDLEKFLVSLGFHQSIRHGKQHHWDALWIR
jgi:hypothetical protein